MGMEVVRTEMPEWSQYLKRPELVRGKPNWWHPGGSNINLVSVSENSINFASRFTKFSMIKEYDRHGLIMEWQIYSQVDNHSTLKHHYQGKMNFDLPTAAAAFGLVDLCHSSSLWMIDLYGGSAARQGFFIRYGDYLTIPGPGTGRDGDANLSLLLDTEVKEWIVNLLPQTDELRQRTLPIR